jgi:hypothetical protein
MIHLHITIVEKGNMRRVLPGDRFANIAMAFVVINWFCGCGDMNMVATTSISIRHNFPPQNAPELWCLSQNTTRSPPI